jgi:3',5'-cyclic AMP phosphodiesterase CpdA
MSSLRIIHASDFHFDGSPELLEGLRALVTAAIARAPDLVIITGDLSAGGRPAELAVVARELARFGNVPRLVLPGNRDVVPSAGPPGEARLLPADSDLDYFLALEPALSFGFEEGAADVVAAPAGAAFVDLFGDLEPAYQDARVSVAGVNSSPRLRSDSLAHAAKRLRKAPPGAVRIFALHHGLMGVPGRKVRDGDLSHRAGDVLALMLDLHVELALHGHLHRAHVWQVSDGRHALLVAGAGALVNDGRRDASFLEIDVDATRISILRRSPTGGAESLYEGPRTVRRPAGTRRGPAAAD